VNSSYYDVSWVEVWDSNGTSGYANYFLRTVIASGITTCMDVYSSEGQMTWIFIEEAANVDPEEAGTKEIASEYSVTLEYPPPSLTPGFGVISLVLALAICFWVKRR
jgi:hypothetical protein